MSIEIETQIVKTLRKGHFTLIEINAESSINGHHCPDDLARILSQMRRKGLIHGEFSEEKSAWVYWADKE
jgi:hypothetical protein